MAHDRVVPHRLELQSATGAEGQMSELSDPTIRQPHQRFRLTRILSLLNEAFWIYLAQGLVALAGLVMIRGMTSFLSPGEYGLLSLVLVGEVLAVGVLFSPLNNASFRFYHQTKAGGEYGTWLVTLLVCYGGVWSVLAVLVIAGTSAAWYVRPDTGQFAVSILLWLALIAGSGLRNLGANLLNVSRRRDRYTLTVAADAWARPIMAMALMSVLGAHGRTALLGYTLAALGSGVLALILFFKGEMSNLQLRLRFSWPLARSMFNFGWPFMITGLAVWIMGVLDRAIIRLYYSNAEVGLYAAGYQVGGTLLMMVGSGFLVLVSPILLQSQARGGHIELHLGRAVGHMIVLMVPVAGVIIAFPELFIALLLGLEYRSASLIIIVRLVAAAMFMANLQLLAAYGFTLLMKTERLVIIWATSSAMVLVLYVILVPRMAGLGAAVATFVGFLFHLGLTIWLGRRALRWPIPYREIGYALAAVASSVALTRGVSLAYPIMPIVAQALLWLTAYGIVALSMTYFLSRRLRERVNVTI